MGSKGQGYKVGAEERIRTSTSKAHYPLKVACLPIPPLRLYFFGIESGKIPSSTMSSGCSCKITSWLAFLACQVIVRLNIKKAADKMP